MESVKNSYPEKKVVDFIAVPISMDKINAAIKASTASKEVKAAAQVIIRNETGNGRSIINSTNPAGFQADSGRWASLWDNKIVATCCKKEGMTGKLRRFIVFDNLSTGIAFLINRIEHKGLFIGEEVDSKYYKGNVTTPEQLSVSYWQEWVVGSQTKPSEQFVKDFVSMYKQAILLFS